MRMFIDPPAAYLHGEPIDFRVGIDGLAARVEQEMALSPLTDALFVFTNRRRDRIGGVSRNPRKFRHPSRRPS